MTHQVPGPLSCWPGLPPPPFGLKIRPLLCFVPQVDEFNSKSRVVWQWLTFIGGLRFVS